MKPSMLNLYESPYDILQQNYNKCKNSNIKFNLKYKYKIITQNYGTSE